MRPGVEKVYYRASELTFLPLHGTLHDHAAKWSDWYTIYRASKVYHTASGFSESATGMSGASSQMILGTSDGTLQLECDFMRILEDDGSGGRRLKAIDYELPRA